MIASIIVTSISVIGSFILVYLSSIKEKSVQKNIIRREQLDKFYIPFYQMYCRGFMSIIKPHEFLIESKLELLELLTNNIYLIEPASQTLYTDFYRILLDEMEVDNNNPNFSPDETHEKYDIITNQLISSILKEYKHILKKCNLPVPSL